MGVLLEGSILFTKEKKMKTKSIFDSKQNKSFVAEICPICGGHEPVTKSPLPGECDGHVGLRPHLRPSWVFKVKG